VALAPDPKIREVAVWIRGLAARHHAFRASMDGRRRLMPPSKDLDWNTPGETLPAWRAPGHNAILQPPKPHIAPATTILQLTAEHDIEPEAGG
jgi:hypothetical protein